MICNKVDVSSLHCSITALSGCKMRKSGRPQARYCVSSPFPPAPRRTPLASFLARRSPVLASVSGESSTSFGALHFGYLPFEDSKHLLGFPLRPALLASLVGRDSDEYYPSSVTLSLSARPAIPTSLTTPPIHPALGPPFPPLI